MSQTFPQYGMAMQGLYPDPTQWSNPYSNFNNAALPFPPGYAGTPNMAATGQPIQGAAQQPVSQPSALGTTLNSGPASQNYGLNPNFVAANSQLSPQQLAGMVDSMGQGSGQLTPAQANQMRNLASGGGLGGGSASPAIQPASQAGSYQNALGLLANPGTPQMSGAAFTPQQATAGGGGQNVLNNFLQNWQQGGIGKIAAPGIGGGSSGISYGANAPFFAGLGATK